MHTIPTKQPRARRIHRAAVLLVGLLVLSGVTGAWVLRRDALVESQNDLRRLSVILAEQARQALQTADMVMRAVAEQVAQSVDSADDGLPPDFSSLVAHTALVRRLERLPQLEAVTMIGADGFTVNATRAFPVRRAMVGDQAYFRHFIETVDPGTYVSEPVNNQTDGVRTVFLARRLQAADGAFVGVVNVAISLSYFDNIFAAAGLEHGTGVTLERADGRALNRFPPVLAENMAEWLTTPALYTTALAGGGYRSVVTQDGRGPRLVYVRPIPGFAMFIQTTRLEASALATWRQQAIGLGLAVLVGCLLTSLLAVQLTRQFDIIERSHRRIEADAIALRASEAQVTRTSQALRLTLEHTNQGIVMIDPAGLVAVSNRRASVLLGLPEEMLAASTWFDDIAAHQHETGEVHGQPEAERTRASMASIVMQETTYERRRPNGTTLEVHSVPLPGGGMVRTFIDITARAEAEGMLALAASRDELTGLTNRNGFGQRLDRALIAAQRGGTTLSVLCLDLDGFKAVNDTHGHGVGDLLLQSVAACMRDSVREGDLLARMGGDEFSVVLASGDAAYAAQVSRRLLDAVRQPHLISGHRVMVGVSIGIATYPSDGGTIEELLHNADAALYQAKAEGRNRWRTFASNIDDREQHRVALESDLREAVRMRQFTLAYQPICDVTTSEPVAFEALLRWNHPLRGPVSPAEFIPLAEQTGLIVDLGRWALEAACAEAAAWALPMRIAVNLSPAQFRDTGLLGFITDMLKRTGLPAARLELELTEGLLLEQTEGVVGMMQALRDLGVRMVLDDFGTANSNLSYLRGFPFDTVKIDRCFLRALSSDRQARALLEAMRNMARALELDVVGEGVETQEQLAILRYLNCDRVQGYLLGRPEPAEVVREGLWQRASLRGNAVKRTEVAA